MTRVWLSAMEWACCGEPFEVGGEVEFVIGTRVVPPAAVRQLGPALAATIDAVEERHPEIPVDDRVRGRVTAVHALVQEYAQTFVLRRPGCGAPPDAEMPAEGEQWPFSGHDLGNGLMIGSRPTRWMMTILPIDGAVALEPCGGVPGEPCGETPEDLDELLNGPEPAERRVRTRDGWLVDVEERAASEAVPLN